MQLINMTQHPIHLYVDANSITVAPSGTVVRVAQQALDVHGYEGIPVPVVHMLYGASDALPAPQAGVGYIVSALYAQSLVPARDDVFVPADPVRNEAGTVIGCKALGVLTSLPGAGDSRHRGV
jgi:hypothetical protein